MKTFKLDHLIKLYNRIEQSKQRWEGMAKSSALDCLTGATKERHEKEIEANRYQARMAGLVEAATMLNDLIVELNNS